MSSFQTPESLAKARQKAEADAAAKKEAARKVQEESARVAAAEARAEAALATAERANRLNRILIVITAVIGFLSVLVEFLANMPAIAENLSSLLR